MTNLLALPSETVLAGDYKIRRVLGAGGFGITYLADELALGRKVTVKEYFPADFAARIDDVEAVPRSKNSAADYKWGLDRFIEEAQTLARFEHPNIVRVFRYFRENQTGYMVLQFEEGKSLRNWLKELGRAPRQAELDQFLAPLLDALELIHRSDYLHRDIAPDNIIIRTDRSPVLIDFGSARGEIASQSRTVSALVKPGYSPYEQYATTTSQQGPWTDIYALGATLYQAVTGKRPPDSPSRIVKDEYVSARDAAIGAFRPGFLAAIDKALAREPKDRPQSILEWRGPLLAPPEKAIPVKQRLALGLGLKKSEAPVEAVRGPTVAAQPLPPDTPQPQGQLLDYIESLKAPVAGDAGPGKGSAGKAAPTRLKTRLEAVVPVEASVAPAGSARHGIGYGPTPMTQKVPAGSSLAPARPAPTPAATAAMAPVPMPIRKRKGSLAHRALFFMRPPWRGLLFKLGVGVGVASLAVAYQNQQPSAVQPSAVQPSAVQPSAVQPGTQRTATVKPTSGTTVAALTPPPQADARPVIQLQTHKGPVVALAFQQSGRRIVSVGTDAQVKVSEADTGILARAISLTTSLGTSASPGASSVAPVSAFSPLVAAAMQGAHLLTVHADGTVAVWDIERGERIASTKRLDGAVTVVTPASESDRFAAAGTDGHIVLLDRRTGGTPLVSTESHKETVRAMAFVPDKGGLLSTSDDKTVKFWDAESLSLKRTYRGHNGPVTAVEVAPDNRSFASGASDGQVRLWSTASHRLIRTVRAHGTRISALGYSADGEIIASAAGDGTVKVWDVKRGRELAAFQARSGSVRALAFTADGRRLVTAGEDGAVRLWDVSAVKVAKND